MMAGKCAPAHPVELFHRLADPQLGSSSVVALVAAPSTLVEEHDTSPSPSVLWCGEADGTVSLRMPRDANAVLRVLPNPWGDAAQDVAVVRLLPVCATPLSSSSSLVWVFYKNGGIAVWDAQHFSVVHQHTPEDAKDVAPIVAACTAILAKVAVVMTADARGQLRLWSADAQHSAALLSYNASPVWGLAAAHNPETGMVQLLIATSAHGIISGSLPDALADVSAPIAAGSVSFAPFGKQDRSQRVGVRALHVFADTAEVWAATERGTVEVWDLFSQLQSAVVELHSGESSSSSSDVVAAVALVEVGPFVCATQANGHRTLLQRFTKEIIQGMPADASSSSSSSMLVRCSTAYTVWSRTAVGTWMSWMIENPKDDAARAHPEVESFDVDDLDDVCCAEDDDDDEGPTAGGMGDLLRKFGIHDDASDEDGGGDDDDDETVSDEDVPDDDEVRHLRQQVAALTGEKEALLRRVAALERQLGR